MVAKYIKSYAKKEIRKCYVCKEEFLSNVNRKCDNCSYSTQRKKKNAPPRLFVNHWGEVEKRWPEDRNMSEDQDIKKFSSKVDRDHYITGRDSDEEWIEGLSRIEM